MDAFDGDGPLSFDDADDFARAREAFLRSDYTEARVLAVLGGEEIRTPRLADLPALLRRTKTGAPLDTLIRLFLAGAPTEVEPARQALAPLPLEKWTAAGFLQAANGSVAARVKVLPFKGLVLAFDAPRALEAEAAPASFVMGVGSSSLTLANLTIRRPARSTLDLGTGCGVQGLLAAAHSDHVYAVDRNPRAVSIAAFNAHLNDVSNVECLVGDRFAPVRDHQFDLVVSNPPFVISPSPRYLFRDSGMHGDEFCQRTVREAPRFLHEGGYCQLLCNWVAYAAQGWTERLASWFTGTGCDVWVLRSETTDPSTYANTWIRETERDDPGHHARLYDEWMAYYEAAGIEAISAGSIMMRRSSQHRNWFRAEDAPAKMLGPCGEDIVRGFALRDFLETVPDTRQLLDAPLRVAPDVRLEQQSEPAPEGWREVASQLRRVRGLAYSGSTDAISAALIGRCNGTRPLGDLLAEVARTLDTDLDSIVPACLDIVRRLIERGFLLPARLMPRDS